MKAITYVALCLLFCWHINALSDQTFGERFCKESNYYCVKVQKHNSWESLFPDTEQRDIVKRINRMNVPLVPGMIIAIPKNLSTMTVFDVAPFPRFIEAPKAKSIFISQKDLAWGAYDAEGQLVWWGPISSGRDWCPDIKKSCNTPTGSYHTFNKDAEQCQSTVFPLETNGGAPMPYCMYFFLGYALHGSPIVPGYRDSHGCVRLFVEDARWLNQEFIDLPQSGAEATRVTILPP